MELESIIDKEIMSVRKQIDTEIEGNTEWLETTEGDEVDCISVENMAGVLDRAFEQIKHYLDEKLKIDGQYMERTSKKIAKLEKQYRDSLKVKP